MQPNKTTRSLAASDFSVKRQKIKWPEGSAQVKNKKRIVVFEPICVIKKLQKQRRCFSNAKLPLTK